MGRSAKARKSIMGEPTEKQIKNRAYEIWEREGKPEGREDEFWALAQQELRNENKSNPVRTPDTL
jgi:Protein of unknown function (DUF2934)